MESCYPFFVGWRNKRREDVQGEVWGPKDVDIPDVVARDAGSGAVVCGWAAVFCLPGLFSS